MKMHIDDQISLKRDQIEDRHVVAATHKQAYELEESLIAKECEELEELKALRDRQRTEIANVGERMTKAEENAIAVGPQVPRWK